MKENVVEGKLLDNLKNPHNENTENCLNFSSRF